MYILSYIVNLVVISYTPCKCIFLSLATLLNRAEVWAGGGQHGGYRSCAEGVAASASLDRHVAGTAAVCGGCCESHCG